MSNWVSFVSIFRRKWTVLWRGRTVLSMVSHRCPVSLQQEHNSVYQCVLFINYANPVYGVSTIYHQVRCLRWGHSSLFHTATSFFIWYKMFRVRDISYRLIWMKFINMLSVYAQSGTHRGFNWWIIAVLTENPSVLMPAEFTDAPKL